MGSCGQTFFGELDELETEIRIGFAQITMYFLTFLEAFFSLGIMGIDFSPGRKDKDLSGIYKMVGIVFHNPRKHVP